METFTELDIFKNWLATSCLYAQLKGK